MTPQKLTLCIAYHENKFTTIVFDYKSKLPGHEQGCGYGLRSTGSGSDRSQRCRSRSGSIPYPQKNRIGHEKSPMFDRSKKYTLFCNFCNKYLLVKMIILKDLILIFYLDPNVKSGSAALVTSSPRYNDIVTNRNSIATLLLSKQYCGKQGCGFGPSDKTGSELDKSEKKTGSDSKNLKKKNPLTT